MKAIWEIFKNPVFLHLLFWIGSVVFWNLFLYPNVDSYLYFVDGLLFLVLLSNFIFSFYCLLPFVWLIKKFSIKKKIIVSSIFLLILGFCLGYWFLEGSKLYDSLNDDLKTSLRVSASYFISFFVYILIFHFTIISSVIFNMKVLIPRLLNKIRFAFYLLSTIVLIILAATLNYAIFDFGIDKLFPELFYLSYFKIWELCLIIAAYLLFTTAVLLTWQYRQMLIAKRESMQNELSALKAQINPHFLFNNLNTIYGLALQKNDRTPKVILQLSDFLRYVLYDTASETIPLDKEVEIIRTYVNLQKERINPEITSIEFVTNSDFKDISIAPLLLLPLVENCFKYGKGKSRGMIKISIQLVEEQLLFITENKITRSEKPKGEKNSGIGISNVEKRLSLIYPGRFTLKYGESDSIFNLEMSIKLNKE